MVIRYITLLKIQINNVCNSFNCTHVADTRVNCYMRFTRAVKLSLSYIYTVIDFSYFPTHLIFDPINCPC